MKSIQLLAQLALTKINDQLSAIELIETGSTSAAYLLNGRVDRYVLRVPAPDHRKTATYESDYGIRERLARSSHYVARPLLTDKLADSTDHGPWALDIYQTGNSPSRGDIPETAARQLGELLKQLHALPVSGYGLLKNTREKLNGECADPISGMLSRFESPWPYTQAALSEHPCILANRQLAAPLSALEDSLREFVESGVTAVVHSDLHEKQLLVSDGELNAVLDFSEAVALRAEWDLGSVLYFHGRRCLAWVLDGYSSRGSEELTGNALLAAVLIALHHGNRGVILNRKSRLDAATAFLTEALL